MWCIRWNVWLRILNSSQDGQVCCPCLQILQHQDTTTHTSLEMHFGASDLAWQCCRYYLVWNWDNTIWGTSCLLSALQPGVSTQYSTEIEGFLASWINGNNGITVTPKGLAWTTDWGSLRNSANAGWSLCIPLHDAHCQSTTCQHQLLQESGAQVSVKDGNLHLECKSKMLLRPFGSLGGFSVGCD